MNYILLNTRLRRAIVSTAYGITLSPTAGNASIANKSIYRVLLKLIVNQVEIVMVLIVYAHPYPKRSHVNQALLKSISDLKQVKIHSLYELYPDFNIDVLIEQNAISKAKTIIMQHPMQWYNMPSMMKLWIDRVFEYNWAYGQNGHALRNKNIMWAVTTGGDKSHFACGDAPGFDVLSQPLQKTALYCQMNWLPPFVIHDTFALDNDMLTQKVTEYQQHLAHFCQLQLTNKWSADSNGEQ